MRRICLAGALLITGCHGAFAFDRAEWREQQQPDGIVQFSCTASTCGGPSAYVSIMPQRADPRFDLPSFTRFLTRLAASSVGSKVKATFSPPVDRSRDGARHYSALHDIHESDGTLSRMVVGYWASAGKAFSLVSSSPDQAISERNYQLALENVAKR